MKQAPRVVMAGLLAGFLAVSFGCQSRSVGGGGGGGAAGTGGKGGAVGTGGAAIDECAYCEPGAYPNGMAPPGDGGKVVSLVHCASNASWTIEFELPDSAFVAGASLPLSDLDAWFHDERKDTSGECKHDWGPLEEGVVEVVAIEYPYLTLKLVGAVMPGASADETYKVLYGGLGEIPPPQDGTAIAMRWAETPGWTAGSSNGGGSASSSTGGPQIDPDTLMIYLSDRSQSCDRPQYYYGCVAPRYQLVISLPPSQQAVGQLPLSGLANLTTSEGGLEMPGDCQGTSVFYGDGTIDILSLGATEVTFSLANTAPIPGTTGTMDGTYTAKRCF